MKNAHTLLKTFCVILTFCLVAEPALVNAQTADMLEQMMRSQRAANSSANSTDTSNSTATSFRSFSANAASKPGVPSSMGTQLMGPMYQVHILGEVVAPGTYRVPASTRLSEAIDLSGGILERGASRSIELRRKGQKTHDYDLVSFKMLGHLDQNPYLLDNDVIYVPLRQTVVQVSGAVRRPATYELTKKTNMKQLIALAGGYSAGVAKSSPIKVIRFNDGKKQLIDVPIDKNDTSHFYVRNSDVVVVPHELTKDIKFDYDIPKLPGDTEIFYPTYEDRIFVLGAVASPGPYAYSPYFNVREYLTQAGGLTKLAKSEKKIYIISSAGKKRKIKQSENVNPGDTIIVPERYMKPESMVQLILGITSAALGITTTVLALTR